MVGSLVVSLPSHHTGGELVIEHAGRSVTYRASREKLTFTGKTDQPWHIWVRNGVLNARPGHTDDAQITVTGSKAALAGLLLNPADAAKTIDRFSLATEEDTEILTALAKVTDAFDPHFNIATP